MKKLLAVCLMSISPLVLAEDISKKVRMDAPPSLGIKAKHITDKIISISGGVERVKQMIDENADNELTGFVKVEGAITQEIDSIYHYDGSTYYKTYYLPFSLKASESGTYEASLGWVHSEHEDHLTLRGVTYTKKKGVNNEKYSSFEVGAIEKEFSLIESEDRSMYLGLYGSARLAFEGFEAGDLEFEEVKEDGEVYTIKEIGAGVIDYSAGITAGITDGTHKLDVSSIYNDRIADNDLFERSGVVQKIGYTYARENGQQFELFYEYDGTASEYVNPVTGKTIDFEGSFKNEHNLTFKINF